MAYGSITINVREEGCKPIVIGELYGGGNQADYSIYGFNDDGSARTKAQYEALTPEQKSTVTVQRDPQINIISATRIGTIYGGGFDAKMIGNPSINVNMEKGFVAAKYATDSKYSEGYHEVTEHDMNCSYDVLEKDAEGKAILKIGTIGTIFGGGSQGDIHGDTRVDIGTGEWLSFTGQRETTDADGKVYTYNTTTKKWDWTKKVGETTESGTVDNKPAPSRNAAFILGKVVEEKYVGGQVFGGGDQGYVYGNTTVNIANGYIYDRVYGGGNEGTVGTVSTRAALPTGHDTHDGCLNGKPTAFTANTGKSTVTVSGGYVGPFTYAKSGSTGTATITPMTMPQDVGYVFAAGRGKLVNPATDKDIDFRTYVDSTEVIISDSALIAGGVYGGSENGRVLRNTHVNIRGGQIGLGAGQTTAYAEADFIDPTTATAEEIATKAAAMPECAHWDYGSPWLPYDEHADDAKYPASTYGNASTTGSDGHTFYGNVFGGGSGYFAYETATTGVYEWLPSAGLVEGDTYVNISGGHILTNVYGGNDLTNVTGTAHVTMTGGTLGVPRTLDQIAAHPVTCYLFGAGKGDLRVHFSKSTNVGHANVTVSGGIIYGSVFGGGEDSHVLGDVTMNISDVVDSTDPENPVVTSSPKIGTWGTSYVDGNVFGGGRGFTGDAYTAGNVGGNVTMNISGGTMLGSIYGGGRLGSVGYDLKASNEGGYGEMSTDANRGHVEINISGGTIGNDLEFQNVPSGIDADGLDAWKTTNHVPKTAYETTDNGGGSYTHRLLHTRGGNVYAGGMGRREKLDGSENNYTGIDWRKLGNVKSTKLTITGGTIKSNVYGGGEYGAVRGNHMVDGVALSTEVNITGGTIGTEIKDDASKVMYTFGSVYGGGTGEVKDATITTSVADAERVLAAFVTDSTRVTVTNAKVRGSVFGGAELASVGGSTQVTISGDDTEIGRNEVKPKTDSDPGYVMFGGATMGNVFGGGRGSDKSAVAGLVQGNTNVRIEGGHIYHNVYGGGALGSVGTFFVSGASDDGTPGNMPTGVPYWSVGPNGTFGPGGKEDDVIRTGIATVTITGGTIGISGRDNGMVFGSSRGGISAPTGSPNPMDPYNKVAWVRGTVVNIGNPGTPKDLTKPLVRGSVYGGGENGHNYRNAMVNVFSGTIGIPDKKPATGEAEEWWDFGNDALNAEYRAYRGNVYGAGSGSDTYTKDGKEYHNPRAGMVGGSTEVNIRGGHIGRSVYGAGAMASVGNITNVVDTLDVSKGGPATGLAKHTDATNSFALSWPYLFNFVPQTGKATVNVTGGHIGTKQVDGGDVYGSARGEAGDRYEMAHFAYANETEVNIDYKEPYEVPEGQDMVTNIENNYDTQCITGSVHGSGENGYVYGDTKVTLNEGLIGHSLYGAGKGKGTYTKELNKLPGSGEGKYDAKIYSLIAGKVMGNTEVTMNGGRVGRNVYGGGNMGSVGKGNYAGGADDYYPAGYGEKITGNLWTSAFNPEVAISESNKPDDAYYFLSSGKATVKVLGGIVGYINKANPTASTKGLLPYGNVFGGSAGKAAANIDNVSDLYLYSPAFFSGYVNETDVTIGTSGQVTDADAGKTGKAPKILGSVYGGGQDGHVRRDAKVTVLSGEIGMPYTSDNQIILGTDLESPQWLHRGNVYGGGSGITEYSADIENMYAAGYTGNKISASGYSTSSGSVTRFTEVNVLGGTIHRNVYGGGSNGSVGAPKITQDYLPYKKGDTAEGHGVGKQSQNTVNIGGGTTMVTIGTPFDSTRGWTYNKLYGGEVYGACRGKSDLDPNQFANSVWTKVNIKDKATIMGNVYGGGDNGIVKKDSEVKVGEEKVQP